MQTSSSDNCIFLLLKSYHAATRVHLLRVTFHPIVAIQLLYLILKPCVYRRSKPCIGLNLFITAVREPIVMYFSPYLDLARSSRYCTIQSSTSSFADFVWSGSAQAIELNAPLPIANHVINSHGRCFTASETKVVFHPYFIKLILAIRKPTVDDMNLVKI